jgi:hypothetical protein
MSPGGAYWGVGGVIEIVSGGALKIAGTDRTAALSTAPAAVAAGYKIARGVTAVTGTADVTTGLATVVSCTATLATDVSLNANDASISIPTQSGGTAGHVTLKVWKPTATNDVTPIASTSATNTAWLCVGT